MSAVWNKTHSLVEEGNVLVQKHIEEIDWDCLEVSPSRTIDVAPSIPYAWSAAVVWA